MGLDARDAPAPDYASSFTADVSGADRESPEKWATAILEGAPLPLRWCVLFGWRFVLGLRLAPAGPGTVAGWTIGTTTSDAITLEVESGSIAVRKVLLVGPDRLTLTTCVWYRRRLGRALWSTLAPVHHRVEPLLITLAASPALSDTEGVRLHHRWDDDDRPEPALDDPATAAALARAAHDVRRVKLIHLALVAVGLGLLALALLVRIA